MVRQLNFVYLTSVLIRENKKTRRKPGFSCVLITQN